MKVYRKLIRPVHCYPGQGYEPKTELVEKEEKWYPEEEREHLEEKYSYLNEGHFSDLIFEEKYEPYLLKEQEPILLENQHKPYGISTNANSPWISRCPRCGKKVEGKQTRFCKYCGQAVKWE